MAKSGRSAATIATAKQYVEWCICNGVVAYPASYESVAGFITDKVRALDGSAKSEANMVSSIKVFGHHLNMPWLSSAAQYKLNKIRSQLHLQDKVAIKRMQPFVRSMILELLDQGLDVDNSPYDLLVATIILLGHNGLLRQGELLCGIQVCDLAWDRRTRSVTIQLPATKTHRSGAGVQVRITDHAGPSAYKFLLRWCTSQNLFGKPQQYIFPRYLHGHRKTGPCFDFRQTASKSWFRRMLNKVVVGLGFNPSMYSGHSLRAGGATDLFIIGVPYPKIKLYGRWKSDAALVYYREDIEVSRSVANAFGLGSYNISEDYEFGRVGVSTECV